jgi:hypothetical protein
VDSSERLRADLAAAMSRAGSALDAANQLCIACTELLEVDGASISVVQHGETLGTFGSSSELSRHLDELQFTLGEGPCLDAVRDQRPVLVPDLDDPVELRWPAFRGAVLHAGVGAVFALPVAVASSWVGALDLFSRARGPLTDRSLAGALRAAELAAIPLRELLGADVAAEPDALRDEQTGPLDRVEVYQATGMIMAALDVGPVEALVRLRAHAFASGLTASEVAWRIVERELPLDADDWHSPLDGRDGPLP